MIFKLIKKLLQRGRKKRQKKARRRIRRFFRKLLGSVLMLALAAGGTYFGFQNRHEILSAVKAKVGGKLKKA